MSSDVKGSPGATGLAERARTQPDLGPAGGFDGSSPRRRGGELLADAGSRFALIGVLVLLWVVFSVVNPAAFATVSNLQTILSVQATTGLLALAVVVPLVAGHFDLSTGFQFGLAQSLCALLVIRQQWNPLLALGFVLVVGVVIGVVNGQLITRLRLPSFTTTLGTGMVVLGLTEWLTRNQVITGPAPAWFLDLGRMRVAGIPLPFLYLAIVAIVLFVLLEYTVWGRRAYAIGANVVAARLSGISADRQVRQSFVITGVLCGLAGCISMMSLGGSSPVIGLGSLLPAFAAAFLGATCIRPGRYNVAGTIVAVYVIGVGITGLQQLGAEIYIQDLFNGAALLIALIISTVARRRRVAG
ncbi:ABC transporter permease [Microbacterium sp. RD1]|uniref:ABC transporter permease n=1 Tax=Microbacterium sp. RD1 TaxID=3457313 RepID=UPI003FA60418